MLNNKDVLKREILPKWQSQAAFNEVARGIRFFNSLSDFTNLLTLKNMGLVEIGAGMADLAPGLRLLLLNNGSETPILSTDVAKYKTQATTIDQYFSLQSDSWKVGSLHKPGLQTDIILDKNTWEQVRKGLIEKFGSEWDATQSDFYQKALAELNHFDNQITQAALLMRQPEISNEKFFETFKAIISNIVRTVTEQQVPAYISTSSRITSVTRCLDAILNSLSTLDYATNQETMLPSRDVHNDFGRFTYFNPNRNTVSLTKIHTYELSLDVSQQSSENPNHFSGKVLRDFRGYLLIPGSLDTAPR